MPISDEDLTSLGKYAGKQELTPDTSKALTSNLDKSSDIKDYLKPNAQMLGDQVGLTSHLAIPESPLSPLERGAFGWIKDPSKQGKYLEDKFGRGNVQIAKMDDDNSGFIVKTKDGKWRQVDPAGLSDIPTDLMKLNPGQALNRIKHFNLRNTIGGAAQFLGEHGLDSTGAIAGGAEGAALGSSLGPLGTLGGGAIGGAIGGGGGALAEAGVRKALNFVQEVTGKDIPGAQDVSGQELHHQVLGSMIFGGTQELAAPFLKAGVTGSGKIFASALEKLGDTPASKQAQAALIKGLSGMKDGLARAWADDPKGVAQYIPDSIKDAVNNTGTLFSKQKEAVNSFWDQAQSAMRGLGKQYDSIDRKASGKVFNALDPDKSGSNPINDAFQRLQQEKYVDSKGDIVPSGTNEITRDTTGTNGQALRKLSDDYRVLLSKNGQASYKDLRIMERNIENNLFGQNQVTDGTLRNILGQMRAGINTVQSKGLHEVDPELAGQLATLNAKYGPAKELLGDLGKKSEDQRLDAFLKQVIKDDGSYNANMMDSVGNLLGIDNPTKDILHMEVAKQSQPMFTGRGFLKALPASPRLTREVVNNVISPIQDAQKGITEAVSPALKKMHSVYKALPDELKQNLVKSPQAISTLGDMISGSVISEKTDKSKLLQQAGAFQNSQFGQ